MTYPGPGAFCVFSANQWAKGSLSTTLQAMKYPTYSGTNGFYSAVFPRPGLGFSTLRTLIKHMAKVELKDPHDIDPDDITFHCTVMYSKAALSCSPAEAARVAAGMTGPIPARCRNFDFWEGHDKTGYFVALLEAPDLNRWHEEWKLLGAEPTFEEFKPHVTLATGEDARKLEEFRPILISSLIARGGAPLVMDNLTIYDLKGD